MSIMSSAYEGGQVTSRVDTVPISGKSNGMTMRYATDTSRTTGNRGGGIQAYWTAEAGTITASAPTIREATLKLNKLAALVYLTDELMQDAPAMEAFVNSEYPVELQWMIQDAYVRGTGVGQPIGVVGAPGTVVAAAEGGQAAGTITAVNIMQMWSQLIASSRPNAVWFVNQAIEPQLSQLSYNVGTGGQLVWMPAGGLSASPFQTLNGRPVIAIEQCSALGTVGDIILGDWDQYVAITKGGVRSDSSIHVRFLNDETALRFIVRVDGQPKQDSTITPANGTTALGRFVTLATRS
jgi:HK97 family phage major capsid protein